MGESPEGQERNACQCLDLARTPYAQAAGNPKADPRMVPCDEKGSYRCRVCGLVWEVRTEIGGGDSAANPRLYEEFHWSLHLKYRTEAYSRLVASPAGSDAHRLELGRILQGEGRSDEAEAVWQELLARSPGNRDCRKLLIDRRLSDGRCLEAPFANRDWERVKVWANSQGEGLLPGWQRVFAYYAGALLAFLDGYDAMAWCEKAIAAHRRWIRWEAASPRLIRDITDGLESAASHASRAIIAQFRWGLFETVMEDLGKGESIAQSDLWSREDVPRLEVAARAVRAFRRGGESWERTRGYVERRQDGRCPCGAWLNWPRFPHHLGAGGQEHLELDGTAYRCKACGIGWFVERNDAAWLPNIWSLHDLPGEGGAAQVPHSRPTT